MPNWCYTSYTVKGDEKEIKDLYDKMLSLALGKCEESLVDNGFGKTWLGNLIVLLGGNWKEIRCRGTWDAVEITEEGFLYFNTETAWTDAVETIEFIQSIYPSLQFYYRAEEPGMGYYVTNDVEGEIYDERYYFATDELNDGGLYYTAEERDELLQHVGEFVGKPINTIKEAEEAISEYIENRDDEEHCPELRIYRVI